MHRTRIYYQDTDAGGVVYFANYLRFFEKSWFDLLLSIGISLSEWEKAGTFFIVKRNLLDLIKPVRYGEEIQVTTTISSVGRASFVMHHLVSRDGEATTKGETEMVCVDGRGRPRRIPDEFRSKLLACQKNIAPTK